VYYTQEDAEKSAIVEPVAEAHAYVAATDSDDELPLKPKVV